MDLGHVESPRVVEIFFALIFFTVLIRLMLPVFLKAQGVLRCNGHLEPRRKVHKKAWAIFQKAHYI